MQRENNGYDVRVETGKKIRVARLTAGLSQAKLAHLAGVSPISLCQWENGRTHATATSLSRVASALELAGVDAGPLREASTYTAKKTPVEALGARRADDKLKAEIALAIFGSSGETLRMVEEIVSAEEKKRALARRVSRLGAAELAVVAGLLGVETKAPSHSAPSNDFVDEDEPSVFEETETEQDEPSFTL